MYYLSYIHFLLHKQLLYFIFSLPYNAKHFYCLIICQNNIFWSVFRHGYRYFFCFIISIRRCLLIKHIGFSNFQDDLPSGFAYRDPFTGIPSVIFLVISNRCSTNILPG